MNMYVHRLHTYNYTNNVMHFALNGLDNKWVEVCDGYSNKLFMNS